MALSVPVPHPRLDEFVARHVGPAGWPGGVYAVGAPEREPRWLGGAGRLSTRPVSERLDAPAEILYDLASLTKPLATAAVAARLAEDGIVDLDRPLDDLLPEMRGYRGGTPTLAGLLAHGTGLPAWAPLYRGPSARPEQVAAWIADLPPEGEPGTRGPRYSDLGAVLAAIACERAAGAPLDQLFDSLVRDPLDLTARDCRFGPLPADDLPRTAPTETGRRREAEQAGDPPPVSPLVPGPRRPLRGEVHDGNAAFLGGVAGQAGLFGTARAVFRLASACLGAVPLYRPDTLTRFREPALCNGADAYTLGFQSAVAPKAPAGPAFGPAAFGHVGFTGTSVFADPLRPLVAVLLTNAIHPVWRDLPIRAWRIEFHDLAAGVADAERR